MAALLALRPRAAGRAARGLAALAALAIGLWAGVAQAQIAQPTAWTQEYASASYPSGSVGTLSIAAGSNRLLLVAIGSTANASATQTVTVSYGGQTLTRANGDPGTSAPSHTYFYYLDDAGITAATSTSLSVTVTGGTSVYAWVYAAVFSGVNQSTPFTSSQNWNSQTNGTSSVGPFATGLNENANDWPIEVIETQRSSSGGSTARTINTWATNWGGNGGSTPIAQGYVDNNWMPYFYVATRAVPSSPVTGDSSQHTLSNTGYASMTGLSLQVAPVITIGTGSDPSNTVTQGQTAAVDAFTLTASTGSPTVTSLAVTLTSYAALSGAFLYDNSSCTGGTQYGSTVTPTSNSVTFNGLSITPSTSGTNLWVCGTAATVASSTAVTAVVSSGVTSASGFTFAYGDTAGTLTVNPPPTITVGPGTNPSNTVTQGQTAAINAFTLQTSGGSATVTSLGVTLTNYAALSSVFLYNNSNCTGGTQYGTAATPAGSITFNGLGINASTTARNVWVCGTAATVASSTAVTAVASSGVTSTSGYVFAYTDTAGTLTVNPPPTITVGPGTNPSNTVTLGQTAAINAFTLQTSTGTATVTSVGVTLTNSSALSSVFLYNNASCTGGALYGTAATPAGSVTFSGLSINATNTATTNVWVCGTAATVASSTAVTAVASSGVTSTSGYVFAYTDTAGTLTVNPPTITIGTGSDPSNSAVAGQTAAIDAFTLQTNTGTATVTSIGVTLTNSSALTSAFLYSNANCNGGTQYGTAATPAGSVTFSGLSINATTTATNFWVCGTAATISSSVNVTAVVASGTTSTAGYVFANGDTAGTLAVVTSSTAVTGLSATVNSCTSITLVASYTGDGNANNGVSFTRNGTAFTCGSLTRSVSGTSGTWTCTDTVPSATTSYTYVATFADADGVSGTNPVTTSVSEAACVAGGGALSLGAHPSGSSPAATANPGQANVLAGRFSLTAASASVYVNQIALGNTGTATSTDLGTLNVYADTGSTVGSWDPGDVLVATANWSSSASAWVTSGFTVPLGTTNYILTLSAAYGATAGDTFALSFPTSSLTVGPKASLTGTTAITGGTVTVGGSPVGKPPGDANSSGTSKVPMVLILNPANGATLSLANPGNTVRVQVQVYDPSKSTVSSVSISKDNFATSVALTLNGAYNAVVGSYAGIYQADIPSTSLPAGNWTLQAQATTTGGGQAYSAPIIVTVNPAGVGDGNLLVRNDSSQLCIDCHAVQSHNTQSTANPRTGISKYGSWGATCRDCHTPHKTHNAQLVRETIVPPAFSGSWQAAKSVRFWDRKTGDSGTSGTVSFVTSSPASTVSGPFGPCQACHTRTANRTGTPRWRNTGNSDTHYIGASTQQCTTCHSHSNGFAGRESTGGENCGKCHSGLFWSMQATGAAAPALPHLTKHTLGSAILGTNDSYVNPSLTWANPLSANAPASRSCVGMCHADHVHNDPSAWPAETHNANFYDNATTQASRALTRDTNTNDATYGFATAASTGSLYVKTDFVSGQYTQGCIACHTNPVDASHPAISGSAYDASAHDVTTTPAGSTWEYVLHDDNQGGTPSYTSRFTRNCTKCHAGNQTEGQTVSWGGSVQGVHYSDNPSLLGGAVNPAGNAARLVCYNCHGNGTIGLNYSAKDVVSEVASSYYHPVNADTAHDSAAEDAATWGNGAYSGTNRHVNCLDCHDPHQAGKVKHTSATATSNAIATTSPLRGASGVAINFTGVGLWGTVPSANFSAVANAAYEYQVCFKCHTTWAWGSGTAPTALATGGSGLQETDLSQEFNPGNRSGHPVVVGLSSYTSTLSAGVHALAAGQLIAPWNTNVGTQTMACSDCHGNDNTSTAIVQGPHGSVGKFILKGTNAQWPTQADGVTAWTLANYTTGQGTSAGLFCLNCHPAPKSTNGVHTNSNHPSVPCYGCHIVIPHGGKLSRLIAQGGSSNMPARYCYQGNKANCYLDGGFQRSATYTSYGDTQCGSSVTGTGSGGCNTQHNGYHPTEQW